MTLCFILASVPIMEDLLYKRSFDLIRGIKPYHTPELTKIMNVLSTLGEGKAYFYTCFIFYLSGHEYEFTYLIGTYFTTQYWICWLKTQIRASRPQFDEPSLGVENESQQCSGEFGNPSGHALLVTMFIPTCLHLAQVRQATWFQRHTILAWIIKIVAYIFIFLVCFCRLYLGRHGLD